MHATLADVIADTAQNSIEAGARHVSLSVVEDGGKISVSIQDDGKGMDEATLERAFNPFYTEPGKHDKRKVGLGLPILKQICESTDGAVSLKSQKGVGTELTYSFSATHIDLPPMGDLADAILMLFNYPGDFDLVFTHRKGEGTRLDYSFSARHIDLPPMGDLAGAVMMLFNYPGDFDLSFSPRRGTEEYSISRQELAEAVGGLESVEGISLAREFLQSQEDALKSGVSS